VRSGRLDPYGGRYDHSPSAATVWATRPSAPHRVAGRIGLSFPEIPMGIFACERFLR
jgi:hypothetical protein